MHILVISTGIFSVKAENNGVGGYSGLEQIAYLQAKHLAQKGHKVSLVAPEGSSCPDVEIIPIGPPGQWNEHQSYNSYWPRLFEFDIILDHSWNKFSYLMKGEYESQGKQFPPILGTLHAPVHTMYNSLPPNVEKPSFVCISKDQASHFEALLERPARVCYNGLDLDIYKPLDVSRTNRFLFLARFSSIKSPDMAERVCKAANVGLDLIGDTSITQEPDYFNYCKSLADGKQIKIIGSVNRGETTYWMSQAHCFLHLNKNFREPFGLAPVEAQACGCPVVAWSRGAMKETVDNGKSGWLVSSEQEALEIVKNISTNGISNEMRKYCRDWASQFSIFNMVNHVESLCEEAIETGGW